MSSATEQPQATPIRTRAGTFGYRWHLDSFRQRSIAIGFVVSIALLALLFVIGYRSNREFVTLSHWTGHTREVLRALDDYGNAVKNAQVSALDYYNNGSAAQLQVFSNAETQGRAALAQVRRLVSDNPTQTKNLDTLVPLAEGGFTLLEHVIQLREAGKSGPDALKTLTAETKRVSEPLGKAYKAMTTEENHLLDVRSAEAARYARRTKWLQIVGGVLSIVLVIATFSLFLRETSFRARAEEQLEQINSDLEHRITQRTAELETSLAETRDAQAALKNLNSELEERVFQRTAELEASNRELEAFCYSVSHDLRAPLRGIDGFSAAFLEDHGAGLDEKALATLHRIRAATVRMSELIDDLLNLSKITRSEMRWERVDLSRIASEVAGDLRSAEPDRKMEFLIESGLAVRGDAHLLQVALQNLLSNSWKFTSKQAEARIEFGWKNANGKSAFYVADNGAGFDPAYSDRLFGAFQRLHTAAEFPGTGVGLATVQRIVRRHGGNIWADSQVGRGATFYFTLKT